MCIEGGEKRTLVDEIVTGVADQADAVEEETADELGHDDDRIQAEGKTQAGL
jgi:hypothetical protein